MSRSRSALHVALVGGGINGVMTAWRLADLGHRVTLFERDRVIGATSQASTKLLHGGLRYLENGELHLVYESLHERTWWVEQAPEWAHPIRLFLPISRASARGRWKIAAGLTLYDLLAGRHTFGRHRWHSAADMTSVLPTLRTDGLVGAYSFFDAQMNDAALGLWAAGRARDAGVVIREQAEVTRVSVKGVVQANGDSYAFDRVVNVAGPWAEQLLNASAVPARHTLDLVRGSHILLRGTLSAGVLVEVPHERRICFVLPYDGAILVGTTEVRQRLDDPIRCSEAEREYLLGVYNAYFHDTRASADIMGDFAGVRPLIHSADDPSRATREYAIERDGRLITVFGGKWTTSRVLARRAAEIVVRD